MGRQSPFAPALPPHRLASTVQDWLTRYGYLPPPHPAQAQLQSPEKLRDAIKVMQRFAGLPETGLLGRSPALPGTQPDHYQLFSNLSMHLNHGGYDSADLRPETKKFSSISLPISMYRESLT